MVCLMAVAVSLPMALVSIAKVALFAFTAFYLLLTPTSTHTRCVLRELWTARVVLCVVAAFALSLFWTQADGATALVAFLKHAKLLGLVLLLILIRSAREARLALNCLLLGQALVLLSSWLMAADVPLFWTVRASGPMEITPYSGKSGADDQYIPFAVSYLDQTLMLTISAVIYWYQGRSSPGGAVFSWVFVAGALLNVLLLMPGRTAYVALIVCAVLAMLWQTPRRFPRWALALAPLGLLAILMATPTPLQERMTVALAEFKHYPQATDGESSVGTRLIMWTRAVKAIAHQPLHGYGVGATSVANQQVRASADDPLKGQGDVDNPHQEFLLWGVELGLGGSLALLALLSALVRDASRFSQAHWRSTVSVLLVVGLSCLFNSPLFDDLLGDFMCVSLGLLLALGFHADPSTTLASGQLPQDVGKADS